MHRAVPLPNRLGAPFNPPVRSLVLVGNCQFSAYALRRYIDEYCNWDPEVAFLRPGHFFAVVKGSPRTNYSLTGQEETLASFRNGSNVNLLVTTQSGLAAAANLPRCNLVASFHPPTTLAAYMAAKARTRFGEANCVKGMLVHFLDEESTISAGDKPSPISW